MPITYTPLANTTFLDYASYGTGGVAPTGGHIADADVFVNVALVLDRANDPTALLSSNWAVRQTTLASLNSSGTLWSTYGATDQEWHALHTALSDDSIPLTDGNGYVSSEASRTVWVTLNAADFKKLFDVDLKEDGGKLFWEGSLSLPDAVAAAGVKGLYFDSNDFVDPQATVQTSAQVQLAQGPQSPGNAALQISASSLFPSTIAGQYYHFPLSTSLAETVATPTVGLIEPLIGEAVSGDKSFAELLATYRKAAGIDTPGSATAVHGGGQEYNGDPERSLDVGVVTAAAPGSPLVLYAGSGDDHHAQSTAFTAYQSAIFDSDHRPGVISSSFAFANDARPNPASPFYYAASQLFVDAALANITVFSASGDQGSGFEIGNGLDNTGFSLTSPYGILVGGTSLSTLQWALADNTLHDITTLALAHDPATLWQLVAGGMTTMPGANNQSAALVETVWNNYWLAGQTLDNPLGHGGYLHNNASVGGVDPAEPVPSYQSAYGLTPTTSDGTGTVGRGSPDVSANAGGNMWYTVPGPDMSGLFHDDGTSAATPLWAALAAQIDAVFHDQGLPSLGYANDLLYIAAAIEPGSFNDITIGNNVSSFVYTDASNPNALLSDGSYILPTGNGYTAGPGYDLVTGLGSPDGMLLTRALLQIAHTQMSFSSSPAMLDGDGAGWTSGTDQSLMFQTMSANGAAVDLALGSHSVGFHTDASGIYTWTSQFAEQALQPDFDPNLVRLYDGYGQGAETQSIVTAGSNVAVSINLQQANAIQGTLTTDYGFADFTAAGGDVRVARAVAVAETPDAANDTTAIVRVRQDGVDSLSISFYRVDDLSGTIGGQHPGDAGYAQAADSRAYQLLTGGTALNGPGYGNFEQSGLVGVNAGDLIAMKLVNQTTGTTFWAFAQANEKVDGQSVGHLWNYGLNTWGWEDTPGGGDHDYNDMIVQLDFVSAAGHGWLT